MADLTALEQVQLAEDLLGAATSYLQSAREDLQEHPQEESFHGRCTAVQVVFPGNPKRYAYQVEPGVPVSVGDYAIVWSPWTRRREMVRVEAIGRGGWTGPLKLIRMLPREAVQ